MTIGSDRSHRFFDYFQLSSTYSAELWREGRRMHAEERICERKGCFWAETGEEGTAAGQLPKVTFLSTTML